MTLLKTVLFGILIPCFLNSYYSLNIHPLSAGGFGKKKNLLFCRLLLCSNDSVPCLQNIFDLMSFHLLIVDLTVCAISVLLRTFSLVSVHSELFSTFSFIRFSVSDFMLKSLICFKIGSIKKPQNRDSFILKLVVYLFP